MDIKYVNLVLQAMVSIFSTMAKLKTTTGTATVKHDAVALGDISAHIGMEGSSGKGSFSISFPSDVLAGIADRMMPAGCNKTQEMLTDLAGELANMISGTIKRQFEEKGIRMDISLPTIFSGPYHEIKHTVPTQLILLPIKTELGPFFIEFSFNVAERKKSA